MDLEFAGKTVIVTGGGSNIGRAISLKFAEEKANVVVADLDEKQGEKVKKEIEAKGGSCIAVKTDITDTANVVAMVEKAVNKFGGVDILVNNVGWNIDDQFLNENHEKWRKIIDINYWGVINCTRAVLDGMTEKKRGVIVNIGSDAGRMGEFREVVYSGCKGAVIAFSKALARELGRFGIRINVVCPGLTVPQNKDEIGNESLWSGDMMNIFTPEAQERAAKAYPLRKLGKAEDIAQAVVFIASDCAGHITGQTLSVSGGYTMM